MTNILSRALGAAAVAGIATLTAAAPAFADSTPSRLIGNQLQAIGLASQNSAVNNGNTGESNSHTSNSGNSAQQVVTDAQSVDVTKTIEVLKKPIILA